MAGPIICKGWRHSNLEYRVLSTLFTRSRDVNMGKGYEHDQEVRMNCVYLDMQGERVTTIVAIMGSWEYGSDFIRRLYKYSLTRYN